MGVYVARPSLLRTKELPEGKPYKGGVTTYRQIARDVRRLLGDSDAYVTTLIDYYGLPGDFPGLAAAKALPNIDHRVAALEAAFRVDIGHPRFQPFLALHEFEAWIFAVPAVAEGHLAVAGLAGALAAVVASATGVEHINDGAATHQSLRITTMVQQLDSQRRYGKVSDGPEIIAKAGLVPIRAVCPHFDGWLAWLEGLA
jgi:hypothetical protein